MFHWNKEGVEGVVRRVWDEKIFLLECGDRKDIIRYQVISRYPRKDKRKEITSQLSSLRVKKRDHHFSARRVGNCTKYRVL